MLFNCRKAHFLNQAFNQITLRGGNASTSLTLSYCSNSGTGFAKHLLALCSPQLSAFLHHLILRTTLWYLCFRDEARQVGDRQIQFYCKFTPHSGMFFLWVIKEFVLRTTLLCIRMFLCWSQCLFYITSHHEIVFLQFCDSCIGISVMMSRWQNMKPHLYIDKLQCSSRHSLQLLGYV